MSPYDERAWADIQDWRRKRLSTRSRRLVPQAVRDRASQVAGTAKDAIEEIPGVDEMEALFKRALGGLMDLGARAAMASVREAAVVAAYQREGHVVADLDDIRKLELRDIDKVKPKLDLGYILTSTVEGAAAGLAVSGGQAVAAAGSVLGAGAGGAPGV